MKRILWDGNKNAWLKQNRGISFDEVLLTIAQGNIVDILEHPNPKKYYGQKIILVNINSYIYCVPFEETNEAIFLKTIFPSRKYTRIYFGEVREQMQPYDESEKKLINSVEQGKWLSTENTEGLRSRLQNYAREEMNKKSRINIRLSERDLEAIKLKAVEEGIPYQTLISSVLHKYVTGILK
jgi:predicted DNA binding CopG/RHH family protein